MVSCDPLLSLSSNFAFFPSRTVHVAGYLVLSGLRARSVSILRLERTVTLADLLLSGSGSCSGVRQTSGCHDVKGVMADLLRFGAPDAVVFKQRGLKVIYQTLLSSEMTSL
jgi:hypothetical protein